MKRLSLLLFIVLHLPAALATETVVEEVKADITIAVGPAVLENMPEDSFRESLADYFKKSTGLETAVFIAEDNLDLVDSLHNATASIAWLPPFSFAMAETTAGGELLLTSTARDKSKIYSCIVSREGSNYNKIEKLKNRNIAWTEPASISGHLFPRASLLSLRKSIDPDSFFKKEIFAGSVEAVIEAVLNGTVEAGATYCNDVNGSDGPWNKLSKKQRGGKQVQVLFVSEQIPGDAIATTKAFRIGHQKQLDKVVQAFLTMASSEKGRKLLQVLGAEQITKARTKDYDIIRRAARISVKAR